MNERIKELAEQATRIEEPDGLFPREVFDQEKFAELIVRECHKVVFQYTGPKSALNILEHFGVEE